MQLQNEETSVRLIAHTKLCNGIQPLEGYTELDSLAAIAIAECYQTVPKPGIIKSCIVSGHTSVLEHLSFTFSIKNISRTCLAQLSRHRVATSPTVESQRYTDYTVKPYRHKTPEAIANNPEAFAVYQDAIQTSFSAYLTLRGFGIKPEDARFAFAEASCCNLTITMNARALLHFFSLRLDSHAQAEIRELAGLILAAVLPLAPLTFYQYAPNPEAHYVRV